MRYYIMIVKKPFQSFVKGCAYWVNETNAAQVPHQYAEFIPAETIDKYDNHFNMLLVRSAGIGDIIALSSLVGFANQTTILTQEKYKPLQKYFDSPVMFKGFNESLFKVEYPKGLNSFLQRTGMMYGDTDIDNGSRVNWFEILSKSVNFEFDSEYGRPQLRSLTKDIDDVCIVVSQSSSINRSADKSTLDILAKKHFKNVIHADEMGWSFEQYLNELDRAKFVISVDTSAIHFREGIGKPALGLYGAFSTDSRTKYYKHTKSIDIKSNCNIQPCFLHEKQCPKITTEKFAPCLSTNILTNELQDIIAEWVF